MNLLIKIFGSQKHEARSRKHEVLHILPIVFCLLLISSFAYTQNVRWEQIKPISAQVEKTVPNINDWLLLEDSEAAGARKKVKFSKFQQSLQQVTDVGNTVNKTTTATSDSTYIWRTSITQTTGSATNRFYNGRFNSFYTGAESQYIMGAASFYAVNNGVGTVSFFGVLPVTGYASSVSTTTNMYGIPTTLNNYGKYNKLAAFPSWIYNYNRDNNNNDAYGSVHQFENHGKIEDYSGFQVDFVNYGVANNADGLLIGLKGDSINDMSGVTLGKYTSHKWSGAPKNSYGIYADESIDIGTESKYFIYSKSKSLSKLSGNFQLDTLRGTENRLAMVNSAGLFFGTKKDSTYYWNSAYSDIPVSGSVTGTTTKTVNIFQRDGGSFSFNFTDNSGGSGGGGSVLYGGVVTDRNIDVTIADYTPSNYDIIEVKPDTEIETGDTITLSINAGTQEDIYAATDYDIDYRLKLMYYSGKWFVMDRIGPEASLKGNVDATNLIVNTNGIQYVNLGEDSFGDSTLLPKWYILKLLQALSNNTTQTLVGTTPYWDVANGKNASITLTGTTTITLANLTDGLEGSLYVTNGSSSSYRITFAWYSVQIYPSVWYSGDEVAVSGSSKTDIFSYKYFGGAVNKLVINGALDVK